MDPDLPPYIFQDDTNDDPNDDPNVLDNAPNTLNYDQSNESNNSIAPNSEFDFSIDMNDPNIMIDNSKMFNDDQNNLLNDPNFLQGNTDFMIEVPDMTYWPMTKHAHDELIEICDQGAITRKPNIANIYWIQMLRPELMKAFSFLHLRHPLKKQWDVLQIGNVGGSLSWWLKVLARVSFVKAFHDQEVLAPHTWSDPAICFKEDIRVYNLISKSDLNKYSVAIIDTAFVAPALLPPILAGLKNLISDEGFILLKNLHSDLGHVLGLTSIESTLNIQVVSNAKPQWTQIHRWNAETIIRILLESGWAVESLSELSFPDNQVPRFFKDQGISPSIFTMIRAIKPGKSTQSYMHGHQAATPAQATTLSKKPPPAKRKTPTRGRTSARGKTPAHGTSPIQEMTPDTNPFYADDWNFDAYEESGSNKR